MRCFFLCLVAVSTAAAGPIDLGGQNSFTLAHGDELVIQFSVWNYGRNNAGYSPYPTSIGLQIAGAPPGGSLSAVPGSSDRYYGGYLLQGFLSSTDGSLTAPLYNADAAALGYGSGFLTLAPGTVTNYSGQAALFAATAVISPSVSQEIFGPNVASSQSVAEIVLVNDGNDVTIGLGPGFSLRNAVSEPGVSGAGPAETAGITREVDLVQEEVLAPGPTAVPEPGTWMGGFLALAGLGVLVLLRMRDARKVRGARDGVSLPGGGQGSG